MTIFGSIFSCKNTCDDGKATESKYEIRVEQIQKDFQQLLFSIQKIDHRLDMLERQFSSEITRVSDLLNLRFETFKNQMDIINSRLK